MRDKVAEFGPVCDEETECSVFQLGTGADLARGGSRVMNAEPVYHPCTADIRGWRRPSAQGFVAGDRGETALLIYPRCKRIPRMERFKAVLARIGADAFQPI